MIPQLIYVAPGDVSVYESQVLELLVYYQKCKIDVILLQGYKTELEKSNIEQKLSKYSIPVIWVKTYSVYPIYEKRIIRNFYRGLVQIPNFNKATIHVRSEYIGYVFKKIAFHFDIKDLLLIDIRGILLEEIKFKMKKSKGLRKILFHIQRIYMKHCYSFLFGNDNLPIRISSVSNKINEYIKECYPQCNYKLFYHPNIAGSNFKYSDEKRDVVRRKCDISQSDVLVVCATGGNSVWQQDFCVIQRLLDLEVKVINLSRKNYGISGCLTTTIPFAQMPDMLSAADIAVLWREDTFINQSASPSKFSEFASMGLYVIHNGTVKVATDYINRTNSGYIAEKVEDIPSIIKNAVKKISRNDRYNQGQREFGVENIGYSYLCCLGLK